MTTLRNFIFAILDDDHGISEIAWDELGELLQSAGEFELLGELAAQVEATDGRFYIP